MVYLQGNKMTPNQALIVGLGGRVLCPSLHLSIPMKDGSVQCAQPWLLGLTSKGAEGGPQYYTAREEKLGSPRAWVCTPESVKTDKAPGPPVELPVLSEGLCCCDQCPIQFTALSHPALASGLKQKACFGFKTQATRGFLICLSYVTALNPIAQV